MFKYDFYRIDRFEISNEKKKKLKDFLQLLDDNEIDKIVKYTSAELNDIFEIAKYAPDLQINIWKELPQELVEKNENISIFESVLDNKFGEYINGVDKTSLVKILNSSRSQTGLMNERGEILFMNVSLLGQMNSPIFENTIAKEAFTFDQLLEIVSVRDTEINLEEILRMSDSSEMLIRIGQDTQSWQAKLQYLFDLDRDKKIHIIDEFGFNGDSLIQEEGKRREELFTAMEKGYFEDEEYGNFDCDIDSYNIIKATFGITYEHAKDLIKKYGTDIDKLDIQNDDDKKIYRKLQIMHELINPKTFSSYEEEEEYFKNYYYKNKDELIKISREISPFFQVELEKEFLDLYARQYDRTLGAQTQLVGTAEYQGKSIQIYEVTGDFMLLIRGEQNVRPENKRNFWNSERVGVKGSCRSTIRQDYIRTVNYEGDDMCYIASTSCKDGELRMASTTNIKSKGANVKLSTLGIKSDYGNGVIFRIPEEQVNNSRGLNNETVMANKVFNDEKGIYERRTDDYIVYIQDSNDVDINQDPRFKTAQFVASQTGKPILIVPREKCAQREKIKIQELKDKLLGDKERADGETDETIIRDLIVKFNNNREGILASKGLKGKYFTESEHIELVGTINARLSQLVAKNPNQYESLVQIVCKIYQEEIEKYYAFSYDRDDAKEELDIDATREHLKPYEDFLMEHERNLFNLSNNEKTNIYDVIRNISKTQYYDMNQFHSLSHIQKVIMFSGILAKNEQLTPEETNILLASAAFHDSGRDGNEGEYDNHAIASARQIKEYFEDNPDNPFGITEKNLPLIQAVIEYHEHKEKEKGVMDVDKLYSLSDKYEIDDIRTIGKISGLLKDADALDRARFGKKNENRWSLDSRYLHSKTAKSVSMLRFSEECNFKFREEQENDELSATVPEDTVEEIFNSELSEFNRAKLQMSSVMQTTSEVQATQKKTIMDVLKDIRATIKKYFEENHR